jgi:hypothetical protein
VRTKKIFQKRCAFFGENTRPNLGTVIQTRMAKEISYRAGHASLVVPGTEHHAANPGENQSARTHRARLQSHIESTVIESPAVKLRGRLAYRQHFCMSGRILISNCPIRGCGNDSRVANDDGAYRHLVSASRVARQIERITDVLLVN